MIIKKNSQDEWQIKTNNTIIALNHGMQVGDFKIPGSGEYEIAKVEIEASDGIYSFIVEDLSLIFIQKEVQEPSDLELKKLTNIDILFLPVAGKGTMTIKKAQDVINAIEPKIVIPIFYDNIEEFTKSSGISAENTSLFKINKNTLPEEEERKVVILE